MVQTQHTTRPLSTYPLRRKAAEGTGAATGSPERTLRVLIGALTLSAFGVSGTVVVWALTLLR